MAHPITTSGTTPQISTKSVPGELPSGWVSRHSTAVESSTPTGDTLTTRWESANGPQSAETNRHAGESDEDFLLRHIQDYVMAMIDEPPIP